MTTRTDEDSKLYDVAVVGAGPAGLFAAFYAGLRGMSVTIIDSMPEVGGQLTALYPEKYIYDVPGFPRIIAKELVEKLHEQAAHHEPELLLSQQVTELEGLPDGTFKLHTPETRHHARTVIIAAGLGSFAPRKLETDNISRWEGRGVYYGVKQSTTFAHKRVLVVGGGDSAVDWALLLAPIAESVTIIHRRNQFRAHEGSVKRLKASTVRIMTPYNLHDVNPSEGHSNAWTAQVVRTDDSDSIEELEVDAVVIAIGFVSSLGAIREWGLDLEGNDVVVDRRMETNVPGVFAIGDVAAYPGKIKLIATAFGEAPVAVSNAKLHIDPESRLQPAHSSATRSG